MTENQVPAAPRPSNYKFDQVISWPGGGFPIEAYEHYTGKVTCTACDKVILSQASAAILDFWHATLLDDDVNHHNAEKHPGLLYVYTSFGWRQLKDLTPDPGKVLNDLFNSHAEQAYKNLHQ